MNGSEAEGESKMTEKSGKQKGGGGSRRESRDESGLHCVQTKGCSSAVGGQTNGGRTKWGLGKAMRPVFGFGSVVHVCVVVGLGVCACIVLMY